MALQKGDWVRTEKGTEGTIVLVDRLSVFVQFVAGENNHYLGTYLMSELTKIDTPPKFVDPNLGPRAD